MIPNRHHEDVAPEKVLWRASPTTSADVTVIRKNGAEGTAEVVNGELRIEKLNDHGCLLVKVAPFELKADVKAQFRADVNVVSAVPDCSHAFFARERVR